MNRLTKYRLGLLVSLCAVAPFGYWVRFSGPGPEWLNDALGSVAYEVFWVLLLLMLFPKVPPVRGAIAVFLITCGIELLQLVQSPFLESLRATVVGRLILGNTFTPQDFIAYAVGSFLGWLWARTLRSII